MALTTDQCLQAPHDHVVQFYDDDGELAAGVAPYLAEALDADGVAIVIATPAHRRAFAARLAAADIDVARARETGRLVMLDAAEAVDTLLFDGRVAGHRYDKLIGDPVRDAAAGGRVVRAYGEIVALLWADGHVAAALELEGLWNGLGREVGFSLYCAYPRALVEAEGVVDAFHEVCLQHSAVVGSPAGLARLQPAPFELTRTFDWSCLGPAAARRFVTETLAAWGRVDLVDDAAVVATELTTNAVLHARTGFTVTISVRPDGSVRLAVRDESVVPPGRAWPDRMTVPAAACAWCRLSPVSGAPSSFPVARWYGPNWGGDEVTLPPNGSQSDQQQNDQLTEGAHPSLVEIVHRIESEGRLDGPAALLERISRPLDAPGPNQLLSGAWLGHALHPLMTDFPLGAWMSATLLDLFGGRRSRPAAQGLVAFGLVCAAPTVASGLVEWRRTEKADGRVGVVHAVTNSLAATCYARSMVPRARGRGVRAAAWSVAGGLLATGGGYLGGHLSIARKIGSRDVDMTEPRSPNGAGRTEGALSGR